LGLNPYTNGLGTLDCGDVPVSPFDSAIAIKQIKAAYSSMLNHPVATPQKMAELGMAKGLDGEYHPRIIALGGDHTIVSVLSSSWPGCLQARIASTDAS
jgi:agmatinase